MRIFKYPSLARFGLIHMSATNICVWFRVIVAETLNSIVESNHFIAKEKQTHVINGISTQNDNLPNERKSQIYNKIVTKIFLNLNPVNFGNLFGNYK